MTDQTVQQVLNQLTEYNLLVENATEKDLEKLKELTDSLLKACEQYNCLRISQLQQKLETYS